MKQRDTTPAQKLYVLGFMFSDLFEQEGEVALIRKTKPEWQKGKLNGIGGKVEENEAYLDAMRREFEEETGFYQYEWTRCGTMKGKDWEVEVFACFGSLTELKTTTDEQVVTFEINEVPYSEKLIDNLRFLIPMCLHVLSYETIQFNVTYPEHE